MSPKKPKVKCRSILTYFNQSAPSSKVSCPACNQQVAKHLINNHLDNECASMIDQQQQQGATAFSDDCIVVGDTEEDDLQGRGLVARSDSFNGNDSSDPVLETSEDFKTVSKEVATELEINSDVEIIDAEPCLSQNVTAACAETVQTFEVDRLYTKTRRTVVAESKTDIKDESASLVKGEGNNSQTEPDFKPAPYYWENFSLILKAVLKDPIDGQLFDEEDKKAVGSFAELSKSAQMLYVRLFQRKLKWLQVEKLRYPEFLTKLPQLTTELARLGFVDDESSLNDLHLILKMMQLNDLKVVMKELNLAASSLQKQQMIDQILKHSKCQRTLFSFAANGSNNRVLKLAKKSLGSCVRLSSERCAVFRRAIVLFTLTSHCASDDRVISRQQRYLASHFLNKKNKFPPYDVVRECKIFRNRDDYVLYDRVCEMESELERHVEVNQFEEANEVYLECRKMYEELEQKHLLSDEVIECIPVPLKRFTVGAALVRCLTAGVDVLQRLKKYDVAVEQLRILLHQRIFHQSYRGRWTERLALNLDQHLKQPLDALKVVIDGLNDNHIRTGHRLDLHLRAKKICNTKANKNKYKKYLKKLTEVPITEPPKVTILGTRLPNTKIGSKNYFISQNFHEADEGETVLCSVEEFAMNHYKLLGYTNGIHGESSTFVTIFGLLFWEVIYGTVPDAFRNPYQAWPLDMNYDEFYEARKDEIDKRLEWIRECCTEDLCSELSIVWFLHRGEMSIVSWDNFSDFSNLQSLVECVPTRTLASVCERYAKDYRHSRSGFPDLVVWNRERSIFKVVEVKGPNDRLSTKQIVWIDFLLSIGVEAEVCHVSCASTKRFSKS